MDIFKWADEHNWTSDYFDIHTGYIYAISKADNKDQIPVYEDATLIGYVNRNN